MPLITIIIEFLWHGKRVSVRVMLTMLPIVFGVTLATLGDFSYTHVGLFLTILGSVLASIKGIVTNIVQVGKLKLHPYDLLMRMSPLALMQTVLYGYFTGELSRVYEFLQADMNATLVVVLLVNGMIAFGLNVASFTANKMTNALAMGVAGNVKQVLSILLAISIFSLSITFTNGVGILFTLVGGAMYTFVVISGQSSNPMVQISDYLKVPSEATIPK